MSLFDKWAECINMVDGKPIYTMPKGKMQLVIMARLQLGPCPEDEIAAILNAVNTQIHEAAVVESMLALLDDGMAAFRMVDNELVVELTDKGKDVADSGSEN